MGIAGVDYNPTYVHSESTSLTHSHVHRKLSEKVGRLSVAKFIVTDWGK
jgi:hypothetical protein